MNEEIDLHTFEGEGGTPTPATESTIPELQQLFNDIKVHPEKYTDPMVLDEIFRIARKDVQAAFDASLQETVQLNLNLVNAAFSTVMKIILHRHGMVMLTPEQAAQLQKAQGAAGKPLVTL